MVKSSDLVAEIRALRARGIETEQLARWLERQGYAQVYSASLLMDALDIDAHDAAVAVCASGAWTARVVELDRVEERLVLVCTRRREYEPAHGQSPEVRTGARVGHG